MPGVPPKVGEMLKNAARSLFNRKKKDKKKATAPEPAETSPSVPPAAEPTLITPVAAPVADAPATIEPGTPGAPKTVDTKPAPDPGQAAPVALDAEPPSVPETEAQTPAPKVEDHKVETPKVEQSIVPPAQEAAP